MFSSTCRACAIVLAICLMQGHAIAEKNARTNDGELVSNDSRSSESEGKRMKGRTPENQLELSGDVEWRDQLERLVLSAQFVTGKDMVALDRLFADKPLTGKEKRSDVDLYLVIRLQTKERLPLFPGPITLKMIPDDDWPFSDAAVPDAVTIPSMHSKEGVVYYVKHLWGASEASRMKFNVVLTSKRWRFRVVDARFK